MKIYPAPHYTMGGLWVDYNLMTSIPGLFSLGESNFSDHGANRLGASALMQGLADGYFVIPYTLGHYLAQVDLPDVATDMAEFGAHADEVSDGVDELKNIGGTRSANKFHQELGKIMWDCVGISRSKKSCNDALKRIPKLRDEFYTDLSVPGDKEDYNKEIENAGRVADYLELGALMARDALDRNESCGCHLREESITDEGEAKRNDDKFAYVAAWQYQGRGEDEKLHKEKLKFEYVKLSQRSYK